MTMDNVSNMTTPGGHAAPNQFKIETAEGTYFKSYNSLIVFVDNNGQVFLDENTWDYSMTTGKYRNRFLNETKKETEKKIKTGIYKLTDLNK